MRKINPLPWLLSLAASISLHVLLFFLVAVLIQLKLINFDVKPTPPLENEPIVFLFIETPEDAIVGEHEKEPNSISDKNALARNPEAIPDLDIGEPYANGVYKSYALPKKPGVQDEKVQRPVPYKKLKKEGEAKKESV